MRQIDEIVHVPVGAYSRGFEERIAFVNKRAFRLGLKLRLSLETIGEEPRPIAVTKLVSADGRLERVTTEEMRACTLYRIQCLEPTIALPGWHYAGFIAARNAERDTATGEIHAYSFSPFTADAKVGSEILDTAFNARGMMRCDHCNTFRNRRTGIVVCDEAGATKIVGSACARDYLGHDYAAILRHFQHINALGAELAIERRSGWYEVVERDFAAERAAAEAAETRRKARTYTLRQIVGAIYTAMVEQGFYARQDGVNKLATAGAAQALLGAGFVLLPREHARVEAILAFARERYGDRLPADPDAPMTLGAYEEIDEGYALARWFCDWGHPLVGTLLYPGKSQMTVRVVASAPGPDSNYGPTPVASTRYVIEAADGTRLIYQTTSAKPLAIGDAFRPATFTVKRSRLARIYAEHDITRLKFLS